MNATFMIIAVGATVFAMIIDICELMAAWKDASKEKIQLKKWEIYTVIPMSIKGIKWAAKAVWHFRFFALGTACLVFYGWLFGVTGLAGMVAGSIVSAVVSLMIMFKQRKRRKCHG